MGGVLGEEGGLGAGGQAHGVEVEGEAGDEVADFGEGVGNGDVAVVVVSHSREGGAKRCEEELSERGAKRARSEASEE